MNFKKVILIAIALWVIIFFEVSILMFGFNLSPPNLVYYTLHYIILIILFVLASLSYFELKIWLGPWLVGEKVKANAKEGFLAAIVFIIVEIILDAAITVPLFVKDWSFFIKPEMLVSDLLALVIFTIVGAVKKKK